MSAAPNIEQRTERLLLRQWREDDFDAYADYYADEKLARFVGGVCDRPNAWRKMASLAGHWVLRGFGLWAVEERATGDFVGCVGLWRPEGWPELELGYWIRREKFKRGYATEAGECAKAYAVNVLKSPSLVSYIDPENEPSKAVATRLGARLDGVIKLLEFGPHCVYRYEV